MKLKLGKVGEWMGGVEGSRRHPPPLLVSTPHFFLHNFWHLLPAMSALSGLEGGSHTHRHAWRIIVVLEGVEEVPS